MCNIFEELAPYPTALYVFATVFLPLRSSPPHTVSNFFKFVHPFSAKIVVCGLDKTNFIDFKKLKTASCFFHLIFFVLMNFKFGPYPKRGQLKTV